MAVATFSELPSKFLGPLRAWIEATPVYVLLVLFVALVALTLFEVCHTELNPSAIPAHRQAHLVY